MAVLQLVVCMCVSVCVDVVMVLAMSALQTTAMVVHCVSSEKICK